MCDTKCPLLISGILIVILSVAILSGNLSENTADDAKTVSFSALTTEEDSLIVCEIETEKVGNFDARTETTQLESVTQERLSVKEESIQESTTECETSEETEAPLECATPLFLVHGVMLDEDLQEFAYQCLCDAGMESYFPVWMCECFQESSFQTDQRTLNNGHYDCGLMQIRETYWDEFQTDSGIFGDILDPYVNISVSVWILSQYWHYYGGDVEQTISHYMSSWNGEYMEQYVSDVLSHMDYLERIR